jgi:hypothetical protein
MLLDKLKQKRTQSTNQAVSADTLARLSKQVSAAAWAKYCFPKVEPV